MINIQLQLASMFLSNVKAVLKARHTSSNEHNASPTLCISPPSFLIIRDGYYWWVSTKVGEWVDGFLKAKLEEADQLVPPVNGWQFLDGSIKWPSDPTMECSRNLSELCREIVVELCGEAKKKWPCCQGSYFPLEGTIIRGRPVSAF